jgi:tRNA (cmo5U34)-methyltransferase
MNMTIYKANNWEFNEDVAKVFKDHVRQSVPMYDAFHDMIAELSRWFIRNDSIVFDLGCATGEVIRRLCLEHADKNVTYVGIDNSIAMIQESHEMVNTYKFQNVCLQQDDIRNLEDYVPGEGTLDFITSVLTLQFVHPRYRPEILRAVHASLAPGGAFILVEKTVGAFAQLDEMYVECYHEMKMRKGLTVQDVHDKQKSLRSVLMPASVGENIRWLKDAGFRTMEAFFKWHNFVGIIAIKDNV